MTDAEIPTSPAPRPHRGLRHHVRSRLLTGLVVIFPLGFTIWILYILFQFLDGLLRPIIDPWVTRWVGAPIAGIGVVAVVIFLYLVGLLAANVIGRQLLRATEGLLLRMPGVRPIYTGSKQVIETIRMPGRGAFQKVAVVEYPRRGLWAIAFVTGSTTRASDGGRLLHLFLPTSPNPTSGMMIICRQDEIRELDMSVEEAIRLVVSGGILTPASYPLKDVDDAEPARRLPRDGGVEDGSGPPD